MIVNILKSRSELKQKYIDMITDEDGMKVFSQVFTHPTMNEHENYEFYEIIGDSTVNKSIVWYLMRRFPKLRTPQGVPIIARLKICLVSKKTLSILCEKLNVWNFVSSDMDTRQTKMKKTLEDVFEAFLGSVEFLIDSKIKEGAGYSFCYNIIKSLFDEIDISLKYNDLYDSKTRLKELFDFYKNKKIHNFKYETKKIDMFFVTEVVISLISDGKIVNITSDSGKANLKQDSEQKASENALRLLYNRGIYKQEPDIFRSDKNNL
jgi:dsRNA-specific ribonuclease